MLLQTRNYPKTLGLKTDNPSKRELATNYEEHHIEWHGTLPPTPLTFRFISHSTFLPFESKSPQAVFSTVEYSHHCKWLKCNTDGSDDSSGERCLRVQMERILVSFHFGFKA